MVLPHIQIRFSGPTAYEPSTFSLPEDEGVDGVETGSVAPYLRSEWTPVPVNSHLADTTPHDQPLADLSLTDKEAKKKRWDFPTFIWKLLDLIIICLFCDFFFTDKEAKKKQCDFSTSKWKLLDLIISFYFCDFSFTDKKAKKKRCDFPTFIWKLLDLIISCLFCDFSFTDKEAKKKQWDFPTLKWKLLDLIISCLFVTSSSLTRRQKRNGEIFLLNPPNQSKT